MIAVVCALFAPWSAAPSSAAAPPGQGFNLNASDLRFILKQIKIAENHVANTNASTGPCGALLGDGPNQIPSNGVGVTLPWGLRTVSGVCNNIEADQNDYGQADKKFPRLVPKKQRAAENGTSYEQTSGTVRDSAPRTISNLIVDQTAGNPAAVAAGGENPQVDSRTGSIFIPNVATDTGLSAPYNSWFTLFGQFFDHGLDLVNKGGNGSVMIPLKADDPKYREGSPTNFMMLTRATQDAQGEANNQTSPFVDQSQTYTSHPSHQVFLREYQLRDGRPVGTGKMISGSRNGAVTEGMADWARVKEQARTMLGIELADTDVTNVPLLVTDPYGRFERGPNGFPLLVVPGSPGADGVAGNADDGVVEGDPSAPVTTAGASKTGHAFIDDIAHHAVPTGDADPSDGPGPITDLAKDTDPGTTDDNNPATYDDEMLDAHFIAGDGRVNENIGLTAVHEVFHSEHNRLTDEIDDMIATDPGVTQAERDAWRAPAAGSRGWDYEERLFQAARFVTEMQYQHLAFEEFARKVQPMVNLFGEGGTGYNSKINPAVRAEFAHAVYRFGHSMLTESVDRTTATGTKRNIPLLSAFLNPPSFLAGGTDPKAATGDIVRGMTRQVGNELDEFVTDGLRNDLLGLPLDLATLNMARARDTGTPTLNEARRKFYAESSDAALKPYTSWADLKFSLKHEESLTNFIAAYGTHDTITAATTRAGKRAAAEALLENASDPDPAVNEDAFAFLNSTGAYTNGPGGVTRTGVDDIDLWVGGLAEKQHVFGGLLGPTFNYVFEGQMEDLQDGDRMYYLSRTAGLNLLTQLEGNSFAELIQRNTDVEGLPADSFSRPDYVFNVAKLGTSGPVPDDTDTEEWNENTMLTRTAEGVIRYGGPAHVVFNGSPGDDNVHSSEGDDTIRGNAGNDRMEGGDGVDNLIGGEGDDIMTDLFGDDVLKGGDGNDALSSGRGFGGDLNQSGRGDDFVVGGNDITETFAGPGDDVVFAGDAEDTVFGDDGDDWIEGGKGPFNLLQGDNGAPFQDDPNEPGHDVLFSYGGEQDYDAEGGDDVMLLGPGIQRSEGMLGFDWTSHKSDPQPGNSDMDITGLLPPTVDTNRDRFDLVESLSGWKFDDTLRGDSRVAADMEGHELDAAGVARVAGLSALLGGATSFTGGNILMGGEGADLIEGRGGDDLIDGDAWMNVQLRATDKDGGTKLVDDVSTLRADVFAGNINPKDIVIVRTIESGSAGTDLDTALFSGNRDEYDIAPGPNGTTVTHARGNAADGQDQVRNVERLQFADTTVNVSSTPPTAPTIGTATPAAAIPGSFNVTFAAPSGAVDSFTIQVRRADNTVAKTVSGIAGTATSSVVSLTDLPAGSYRFAVSAVNLAGAGPFSEPSNAVSTAATPGAPTIGAPSAGNASATVRWTAPANNGGAAISGYSVRVWDGATLARTTAVAGATTVSTTITGLTNGRAYTFDVAAVNTVGTGAFSTRSAAVTPVAPTTDAPPTLTSRSPAPNVTGVLRTVNATATFSEPVTGVVAGTGVTLRNPAGTAFPGTTVAYNAATRTATINPGGTGTTNLAANTRYTVTFTANVRDSAGNPLAVADRTWSFTTGTALTAVTVPGAPTIGAPTAGNASATVRWTPPANNGGAAITGYRVRTFRGTTLVSTTAVGAVTSTTIAGLTNGQAYTFDVAAVNSAGAGAPSGRSTAVTPRVPTTDPAPTITSRSPAQGATGVSRTGNLTATFSEAVTGVIVGTGVTLRNPANAGITGTTVTYNATTRTVTINPGGATANRMAANTRYTVTFTTNIRDTGGNPLPVANRTWTFTTGP